METRGYLTVIGRLHRFAEILERGHWVTSKQLAFEEEVTVKTVGRTMDFFRDVLRWDIESSHLGYRLLKKGQPLIRPTARQRAEALLRAVYNCEEAK